MHALTYARTSTREYLCPCGVLFVHGQWPLTHKTSSILAEVVRLGYDEYPELSLSLSFANPEGQPVAIIQPCGLDPDKGAKDWESVKARVGLPPPLMEDVGPRPYVELQGMMETLQPPSHCYEKGWLMKDFTPAVADKVIDGQPAYQHISIETYTSGGRACIHAEWIFLLPVCLRVCLCAQL